MQSTGIKQHGCQGSPRDPCTTRDIPSRGKTLFALPHGLSSRGHCLCSHSTSCCWIPLCTSLHSVSLKQPSPESCSCIALTVSPQSRCWWPCCQTGRGREGSHGWLSNEQSQFCGQLTGSCSQLRDSPSQCRDCFGHFLGVAAVICQTERSQHLQCTHNN